MKAELAGGSTSDRQALEGGQGQSQPQQQPQDTPRFDKQ
jgi:phage shock protein A